MSALPLEPSVATTRPGEYRRLTADECRRLAIANAPLADDLDRHPDNTPTPHPRLHPFRPNAKEAHLGRVVRGYAADELRNRAAADALDDFFQLAQAEGQFDLLAASHAELLEQVRAAEEAIEAGLKDRADVDSLKVRVLDIEAELARLEAGIGSLNESLEARLGLDAPPPLPIWPDDPLRVSPHRIDVDEAVRVGLYYRPDLNLLRSLLSDGGRAADDLTRAVLAQVSPLLAVLKENPITAVFSLPGRREPIAPPQLVSLLHDRERQAEAEIRAAALTVAGHRAAATAKAAEVRRLSDAVDEIEKREAAGLQVAAELTEARLKLLAAKGELLKAAADWNTADIQLRKAMGLLVRDQHPPAEHP